jgi:DNA-binding SARP family transcriptional activator
MTVIPRRLARGALSSQSRDFRQDMTDFTSPLPVNVPLRLVSSSPEGTPPRLRLILFGPMQARDATGGNVLPRQRKSRAVLAVLALAAPRPLPRIELTGLLWSRRDDDQARASLRQAVHEVQHGLAPLGADVLRADRTSLALSDEGLWLDAAELAHATASRPEALCHLDGGTFLQDLAGLDPAFDRWIRVEQGRLLRGAAQVAEAALAAHRTDPRDDRRLRVIAERLLAIDPTHEAGWRALMEAHAAAGDRAAATEAFERCVAALAQHAERMPSTETRALLAAIRAGRAAEPTVEPIQAPSKAEFTTAIAQARRGARFRGVRLGVMPFRAMASELADGLAFGLAEEITTALARFRWISLIASPSLAVVQAEPPAVRDRLLRGLDIDFMLDGTIQRAGGRVRVMTRLLDMRATEAGGAELVWSHRFDGDDTDLLTLQDRIAAETVARVDPQLLLREGHSASGRNTSDITAYDLLLRAIPAIYRLDEPSFRAARELLAAAVARDPKYAAAHAWWAYWSIFLIGQGWATDTAATLRRAGELADRAIALDPSDARGLTIAGHVRAFLEHRAPEAMILHDRALELNPNLPLAWVLSGLALAYDGKHEAAISRAEEAHRLSPFDPHHFFYDACEMVPELALGRFDRVVELARRSVSIHPGLSSTYKGYLSALGHLGATEACAVVRGKLLALEPRFNVASALARSPLRRPADRALYAEGLRRAGLPLGEEE